MLEEELFELVDKVRNLRCEGQVLELKSAHGGCPKIYDTLSSFANQNQGGTIIFGIDETNDYEVVGVYNAQDLLHKISEQCNQMSPVVRGVTTECEIDGKTVVSLEIPPCEIFQRPVYYMGAGVLNGSYVRVGEADEPMTEYEVYSYQAYKEHKQDDIRKAYSGAEKYLDNNAILKYLDSVRRNRPNTQNLSDDELLELMGVYKDGCPTISAVMCFSKYPQALYPQLCITAVVVPGYEMGDTDENNGRFIDNKRIEGTIPEMLEGAMNFVIRNIRTSIAFVDGRRVDKFEYPLVAIREAILNALVHRDYSIYTEGMPIRIEIYKDRIEIVNSGGLYGAFSFSEDRIRADTRNKTLVAILEAMDVVENRYSGIPTIYKLTKEAGLKTPMFVNDRGNFKTVIFNGEKRVSSVQNDLEDKLVEFCNVPRTKKEIAEFVNKTQYYAMKKYVEPLVARGLLAYTLPDKPKSKLQRIFSVR